MGRETAKMRQKQDEIKVWTKSGGKNIYKGRKKKSSAHGETTSQEGRPLEKIFGGNQYKTHG